MKKRLLRLLFTAVLLAGCAKNAPAPSPPDQPPHGGTVVGFAHGIYHLELVREAGTGRLTAYVLDGELENYIRAGAPAFEITAKVGGKDLSLIFQPVANLATGETLTDTSQYDAQADWLKHTPEFDAELRSISVRGTLYPGLSFRFPQGNDPGDPPAPGKP